MKWKMVLAGLAGLSGWAFSAAVALAQATAPDRGTADTPPSATPPAGALSGATPPGSTISTGAMNTDLPNDLSPWGMFLNADVVVKVVLCGLVFASVLTWTVWLAKSVELATAKRRLRAALPLLREASNLAVAAADLADRPGTVRLLVDEAQDEWRRSLDALDDRNGLKERVALRLGRVEAMAGRRMAVGTGILATIGSTAPFVGLFGTVWGIMNSFIGISRLHTTNLAVVAPGIAEALLATACGLIAAIPAVVIYNHFARQIAAYKAMVGNAASTVMTLVSRDLSRGDHGAAATARRQE